MLIAGTTNLGPDQTATTKSTARGNGQVQSNTSAHMHIAVVWLGLAWLGLVWFGLFCLVGHTFGDALSPVQEESVLPSAGPGQ